MPRRLLSALLREVHGMISAMASRAIPHYSSLDLVQKDEDRYLPQVKDILQKLQLLRREIAANPECFTEGALDGLDRAIDHTQNLIQHLTIPKSQFLPFALLLKIRQTGLMLVRMTHYPHARLGICHSQA